MKLITVLVLAVIASTTFNANQSGGSYNLWTGEITCTTEFICFHETAHKMDKESGWVSKSDEWQQAVDVFIEVQWQLQTEYRHALADCLCHFPGVSAPKQPTQDLLSRSYWTGGWGDYTELYAELWAIANGKIENVPPDLQRFYEVK